jgi:hypothetical protein
MDQHRQTVGYYDATGLTAPQRDDQIVRLRCWGYSYRGIAKVVGMAPQGVLQALRRVADPAPVDKAPSQVLCQVSETSSGTVVLDSTGRNVMRRLETRIGERG